MAEAKTEITIDVDYKGRVEVRNAIQDMKRLGRQVTKTNAGFASVGAGVAGRTTGSSGSSPVEKFYKRLTKQVTEFDKALSILGKVGLKGLSLALKGSALSMAAMGVAMLGVHAAFVLGNAAMKAMKATLGPLAAGMAAVVTAAAAAAAAVREQQAAMYAYKPHNKQEFGSGLNQARQVMRALHTDTYLASAGVENLNKAFATVSKNSTFTMKSQNILKGLMDFASAGQPVEEGIQKAADLIAILQDSKKSFAEAKASAQQLFPGKKEMDKAFKDLKITTKKGLEKSITSGELSKAAKVDGQFEAVSGTLINRLKGYFNIIKNQFADLGQPLLEPLKEAAKKIFDILRTGFVKLGPATNKFGMGSMLDGLVSMVQKLTDWSVKFVYKNLKSVDGMFSRMGKWWDRFQDGWDTIVDKLRPFIDGARVIESFFGEIWKHVKNIFSAKFDQFNGFLVSNKEEVKEFGDSVGKLLADIFELLGEFNKLTQRMLPFINDLVRGLSGIVNSLTSIVGLMNKMGGGAGGALAMLFGMRGMFQGAQAMGARGGYKQTIIGGVGGSKTSTRRRGPTIPGTRPTPPSAPTGPTVVTGTPTGGLGTTHATPPGTTPTTPIGTTPGTGGPGTFASASRVGIQRPEYEVFKRAPKGGTTIDGKFYKGGQMLPTSQITASERSYFNIEDRARPGTMSPMADTMTDAGAVSMRAGTTLSGATATPAAASTSAFASVNKAGKPIAPAGGVTVDGKFYPKGRQLPANFASRSVTPGPATVTPTAPPTTGTLPPGTLPPGASGPRVGRQWINRAQQRVSAPIEKVFGKNPTHMYLPGKKGNWNNLKAVTDMTPDEFRMAKKYRATWGEKAYKGGVIPQPGTDGELTMRGKYNQRSVENRTKMDTYRGRQLRGAMGSTTAKMGGSIALGMASQYMPEEAQGAMALGSMVSQINPLAGLGVAGLGTAMKAKTIGGGALSGAAGGAATGALIGSILPGIGTAAGAIVGTLVGGLGGALMGHLNAQNEKAKKARAVADKQIASIVNLSMSSAFTKSAAESKSGNLDAEGKPQKSATRNMFTEAIRNLSKQQTLLTDKTTGQGVYDANGYLKSASEIQKVLGGAGVKFSDQDVKDMGQNTGAYVEKAQSKGLETTKAATVIQEKYNNRLDALSKMTGKSDQQLIELASTMGVNLGDATMDFTDMITQLGLAMVKSTEEMQGLSISNVVDSFSGFDEAMKAWETPRILNEMARTFRDKADAGTLTKQDKAQFLKDVGEQNTALFGTGGVAQAQFEESFGVTVGKDGKKDYGSAFKKGGPLYGMDPTTFSGDAEIQALLDNQKLKARTSLGQTYGTQLNAVLGEKYNQTIDATAFTEIVKGMTGDQLVQLEQLANKGFDLGNYRGNQSPVEAILSMIGGGAGKLNATDVSEANKDTRSIDAAALGISDATGKLIKQMDAFFQRDKEEKPDWFTKEAFKELIDSTDTSTPRGGNIGDTTSSRLATTMGRHSAMDASLTGKRTVTSAYRTTGLGSINSDHVTGRAYDLVGQNLGQYQTLAKAGGGFAEFHGVNKSRHLHVVPGPGIGDTRVPMASLNKPMPMAMSGGSKGDTNYTFHIQGGENASPKQIADAVMIRIKETERSNRERR